MRQTRGIIGAAIAVAVAAAVVTHAQPAGAQRRINRIIEQVQAGKAAYVNTHWDWIEMEIGVYDVTELKARLAKLKTGKEAPAVTPVLRIPIGGDEPFQWMVKQALQLGLSTIVIPQVDNAEQSKKLVEAMRLPQPLGSKYPEPQGVRSSGAPLAGSYWGVGGGDYTRRADVWPLNPEGEMLAIVMVESMAAVNNINEIVNVPGLGGVMLGPADLRASIGLTTKPDTVPAAVEAAIQKSLKACLAKKPMICAIAGVPPADRDKRAKEGFNMIHGNFDGLPPAY
jgi:4-hydroxy-2-oxoheptanedioate aldolase